MLGKSRGATLGLDRDEEEEDDEVVVIRVCVYVVLAVVVVKKENSLSYVCSSTRTRLDCLVM